MGIKSFISKAVNSIKNLPSTIKSIPAVKKGEETLAGTLNSAYGPTINTYNYKTGTFEPKPTPTISKPTPTISGGGGGSSSGGGTPTTQQSFASQIPPGNIQQLLAQQQLNPSKSGGIVSLQQQYLAQQQRNFQQQRIIEDQRRQQQGGFSGKVEVTNQQGQPEETQYYVGGKKTGVIKGKYAETIKPSRIEFNKGREVVQFGKQGATQDIYEIPDSVYNADSVFEDSHSEVENRMNATANISSVDYNNPSARQQLPAWERIKYAYTSAPGEPFSIRGGMRAFIESSSIVGEKIHFDKILQGVLPKKLFGVIPTKDIINMPVRTRFAEDIAISGLFLGGTTPSTTQIEKELFDISKVTFKGVTQELSEGKAVTKAGFMVNRAGRSVKGLAQAETSYMGTLPKGDIFQTKVAGVTFKKAIEFPTSRLFNKKTGEFIADEITGVIPKGEIVVYRGVGLSKQLQPRGVKFPYQSAGVVGQKGEWLLGAGVSESKQGVSYSVGALKLKTGDMSKLYEITGSGGSKLTSQLTKELSKSALQGLQSGVRASVEIPVKPVISKLPTGIGLVSAKTTAITTPKITSVSSVTQTLNNLDKPIQNLNLNQAWTNMYKLSSRDISKLNSGARSRTGQGQPSRTGLASLSVLGLGLKQPQATKQQPRLMEIEANATAQKYRVAQLYKMPQLQKQQFKSVFPTPRISTPKTKGLFLPIFKLPSRTKTKATGKYSVFSKRFGKWFNLGKGLNLNQALGLGREYTAKTLARSFKVKDLLGRTPQITLPGYRKAKKGRGVVVEKSRYALNMPGEINALLGYPRRKKKKRGMFDLGF